MRWITMMNRIYRSGKPWTPVAGAGLTGGTEARMGGAALARNERAASGDSLSGLIFHVGAGKATRLLAY